MQLRGKHHLKIKELRNCDFLPLSLFELLLKLYIVDKVRYCEERRWSNYGKLKINFRLFELSSKLQML